MASVLSLSPSTPFGPYDVHRRCRPSISSLGSVASEQTVRHHRPRHLSISSLLSRRSFRSPSLRKVPSPALYRLGSTTSPANLPEFRLPFLSDTISINSALEGPQSAFSEPSLPVPREDHVPDLQHDLEDSPEEGSPTSDTDGKESDSDFEIWHEPTETLEDLFTNEAEHSATAGLDESQAFDRWLSNLRRRNVGLQPCLRPQETRGAAVHSGRGNLTPSINELGAEHRRSGSHMSSNAFVTGVRSASMTMTNLSLPSMLPAQSPRSPQSLFRVTSDFTCASDARRSFDSETPSVAPSLDEAAIKRSLKRARKVQELLRTEQGYLADLRLLVVAYATLISSHGLDPHLRHSSAQACFAELVELHEGILARLQDLAKSLIPYVSSAISPKAGSRPRYYTSGALRPFSPDRVAALGGKPRISLERTRHSEDDLGDYLCTPQLAAEIAGVFSSKAKYFSLYEEYGVRCESLQALVDDHRAAMPEINYDRALETLQSSVCAGKGKARNLKKALGLKDLLIKPIQRITRYELLLKDLYALTTISDDPISHSAIDEALFIISQTCHDLNEARGNAESLRLIDSQRLMQQRCTFDARSPSDTSRFGKLLLCGALFVAYRSVTTINGQYYVCALYESCAVVAIAKGPRKYDALLTIPWARATVEEADNGKGGLQCHTTPHTWKIVFENDDSLFEVLCAACSKAEADAWRQRISGRIAVETQHLSEGRTTPLKVYSPLANEMRSVGKAYGRAVSFSRRTSVQRAATLGPTTELNQVIIKGTVAAGKDGEGSLSSLPIPRSQSVLTPSHIPTLTPRRSDRVRLEVLLSDVWTRDALPYPGLGSKRGEYSMRASANHVIRKLSIASITSNFSRRSLSHANISQPFKPKAPGGHGQTRIPVPPRKPSKPPNLPLEKKIINFHTAPEAFLPEDFELKDPSRVRGRLAGLRTFTMGSERPKVDLLVKTDTTSPAIRRSRSAVTRRTPGNIDVTSGPRSQTAMSTPSALTMALVGDCPRKLSKSPPAHPRPGRRGRAKSRLARLLA